MRLFALAFTAAALAVAVIAGPNEGNWARESIEGLTPSGSFEHLHALHGDKGSDGQWRNLAFWSNGDGAPLVSVHRNASMRSGWEYIRIEAGSAVAGTEDAYYLAGYAEGYLTMDDTYSTWWNQVRDSQLTMSQRPEAVKFIQDHIAATRNHETATPFGRMLRRIFRQAEGIADGWRAKYDTLSDADRQQYEMMNFTSIYLTSYMEELANVNAKYASSSASPHSASAAAQARKNPLAFMKRTNLHCSALMRLTADDFFFAHDTWSSFNTMLRQYKTYNLGDGVVIMSSYAGSISSIDDWYMTSNQLAVTETTNGFYNTSLYQKIQPTQVAEFARVMIANYLATSPLQWFQLFAKDNSGTYNNQYMVADMAAIRKAINDQQPPPSGGIQLPRGSFYVGEQIPGYVHYEDQTDFVNNYRHWPSYNVPFYPDIYRLSGFTERDTPEYFGTEDYHQYSRARIFKRMYGLVTNVSTMFYMMRFNNFADDHDSTIPWCKTAWTPNGTVNCPADKQQGASMAIASRYDLNPTDVPLPNDKVSVYHGPFGAIDTKITSARMMDGASYRAIAINGPTHVQQPVFVHSDYIRRFPKDRDITWRGVADRFDYPPVMFDDSVAVVQPAAPVVPTPSDTPTIVLIALFAGLLIVIAVYIAFQRMRRPDVDPDTEGMKCEVEPINAA